MTYKKRTLLFSAWVVVFLGLGITTLSGWFIFGKLKARISNVENNKPDIVLPNNNFTSDIRHSARCGLNLRSCEVRFNDGSLIVGSVLSIKRNEFLGLVKSTECRQRFLLFPLIKTCLQSQYDRDYTITYKTSNRLIKSTQISFRPGHFPDQRGWNNFQNDLQTWIGEIEIKNN